MLGHACHFRGDQQQQQNRSSFDPTRVGSLTSSGFTCLQVGPGHTGCESWSRRIQTRTESSEPALIACSPGDVTLCFGSGDSCWRRGHVPQGLDSSCPAVQTWVMFLRVLPSLLSVSVSVFKSTSARLRCWGLRPRRVPSPLKGR